MSLREDLKWNFLVLSATAERAIREKIVLLDILRELHVPDPEGLLRSRLESTEVQHDLDQLLQPLEVSKRAVLAALQGVDGEIPSSEPMAQPN